MAEIDTKQKVLLAIYAEYQRDLPDMENALRAEILGLSREVFYSALLKLINEGFITGFEPFYAENVIFDALVQNIMMTRYGIEYVEKKFEIEPTLSGVAKRIRVYS